MDGNTKIDMTDDKTLVIICVTMLGLFCLWALPDPTATIQSVISGLFGVAVEKRLQSNG